MRILFTNNPPVISFGLAAGLEQIGVSAKIVPLWQSGYSDQGSVLEHEIASFRPDYVFTEGDPPNFNREAVLEVCRRLGLPVIYWAIQDPLWFREISKFCAERADCVLTTAVELLGEYERLGRRAHLLMFACNRDFHRKVAPVKDYCHDFVLVGNNYPRRQAATDYMVRPLVAAGRDLMVWGQWWTDGGDVLHIPDHCYGGLLPYHQLPEVYSSARIVLGLHLCDTSLTQTSVRTFEALGCGAFYLTQYTRAHERLFQRGVHLDWAANEDELLSKASFYLNNGSVRERIARQGQEHVYRFHTYAQRARQLADILRAGL